MLVRAFIFRFSLQTADVIHRPCCLVGVECALVSLVPHMREGAERRKALRLGWHLCEGAACFAKHARLPALHWWRLQPRDRASGAGRGLSSHFIPAGFPAVHPDPSSH